MTEAEKHMDLIKKYNLFDANKVIVVDDSGFPLFKSYFKIEDNNILVEYTNDEMRHDVSADILNRALTKYKGKLIKEEDRYP